MTRPLARRRPLALLPTLLSLGAIHALGCGGLDPDDPLLADGMIPGGDITSAAAQPGAEAVPAGYYDAADPSGSAALRGSLHAIIDDHQRFPYTSTATDTWDILELAQQDPQDQGRILDLYHNLSLPRFGGGNTYYNREHAWPSSHGFTNDNSQNYPFTDCHHLFLSDDSYNSSRSNKPYRTCTAACAEKVTEYNSVTGGGGSGAYPGNSNWTTGAYEDGTWETWIGRRGDVARALLYLDVRYEGGAHGVTGAPEPDLILTDNAAQVTSSDTNQPVAYMGMLSVLLEWHQQDPVDDLERQRNDVVYSFQGNRNPFIDHPEWAACVFQDSCGGGGGDPACNADGVCGSGESCTSCPADCPSGDGAQCGNGVCEAGNGEDCVSCPADCNGAQGGKTSKRFCCGDGDGLGPVGCNDSRCSANGLSCTTAPAGAYCCGNGVAEGPEGDGRSDGNP